MRGRIYLIVDSERQNLDTPASVQGTTRKNPRSTHRLTLGRCSRRLAKSLRDFTQRSIIAATITQDIVQWCLYRCLQRLQSMFCLL